MCCEKLMVWKITPGCPSNNTFVCDETRIFKSFKNISCIHHAARPLMYVHTYICRIFEKHKKCTRVLWPDTVFSYDHIYRYVCLSYPLLTYKYRLQVRTLAAMHTGVVQNKSITCQADRFFAWLKERKIFMSCFLAPKQPSTVKNGNQCAWQPVS
jgi:hypothetical protein